MAVTNAKTPRQIPPPPGTGVLWVDALLSALHKAASALSQPPAEVIARDPSGGLGLSPAAPAVSVAGVLGPKSSQLIKLVPVKGSVDFPRLIIQLRKAMGFPPAKQLPSLEYPLAELPSPAFRELSSLHSDRNAPGIIAKTPKLMKLPPEKLGQFQREFQEYLDAVNRRTVGGASKTVATDPGQDAALSQLLLGYLSGALP